MAIIRNTFKMHDLYIIIFAYKGVMMVNMIRITIINQNTKKVEGVIAIKTKLS